MTDTEMEDIAEALRELVEEGLLCSYIDENGEEMFYSPDGIMQIFKVY